MTSYSPQLQYTLSRLSGFTTNTFKLQPNGSDSATAGQTIRISLPQNSLVNMRSFAFNFKAAIIGGGASTNATRLPPGIGLGSLIERVEITVGGLQIAAGSNFYNVLAMAKKAVYGDAYSCDTVLGHAEVVRDRCLHRTDVSGIDTNGREQAQKYCVNDWQGFLGSCSPKILDLGLMADMVVHITLANNNVCIDASGSTLAKFIADPTTAAPKYQLTDIYATVECIGLSDGTYEAMINEMMSRPNAEYVEIPFKNYLGFQDHTQSNMKFSVASQSISRIWIVHRDDNFAEAAGAVSITGYQKTDTSGTSGIFNNILDYNKEKYTSKWFNFASPAANHTTETSHWLTINGSQIPQWQATQEDMFQITKNSAFPKPKTNVGLATMKDNYSVYCVRLNMEGSEQMNVLSGIDSRGITANMFYNMLGVTGAKHINVFVECDSTLRLGRGLQAEVLA